MTKFRIKNKSERPEFDVGDILEVVGCKMYSRKLLKLNGNPESLLIAWGLSKEFFHSIDYFERFLNKGKIGKFLIPTLRCEYQILAK